MLSALALNSHPIRTAKTAKTSGGLRLNGQLIAYQSVTAFARLPDGLRLNGEESGGESGGWGVEFRQKRREAEVG